MVYTYTSSGRFPPYPFTNRNWHNSTRKHLLPKPPHRTIHQLLWWCNSTQKQEIILPNCVEPCPMMNPTHYRQQVQSLTKYREKTKTKIEFKNAMNGSDAKLCVTNFTWMWLHFDWNTEYSALTLRSSSIHKCEGTKKKKEIEREWGDGKFDGERKEKVARANNGMKSEQTWMQVIPAVHVLSSSLFLGRFGVASNVKGQQPQKATNYKPTSFDPAEVNRITVA